MKFTIRLKYIFGLTLILLISIGLFLYKTDYFLSSDTQKQTYTYAFAENTAVLLDTSDVILTGNILNTRTKDINIAPIDADPLVMNYTVVDILVTDIAKGNVKVGDTIQVKYLNDDNKFYNRLNESFSINSRCVLFLTDYTNIDQDMPYSLINPVQGVINLDIKALDSYSSYNEFNFFDSIPRDNLFEYIKESLI